MNHNHPLNNTGYQNLRMRLMTVLKKAEEYLDIRIEKDGEHTMKVWTLKFRWYGDEDEVHVARTKQEAQNIAITILHNYKRKELEEYQDYKSLQDYCFDREIAYFEVQEHTI